MSVTRTPAGISNEHLFHKAEAVVYVEGGTSATGNIPAASTDILFWRGLFDRFAVGRHFHFKPRCGKQTLLTFVDRIVDGTIDAVIVCLDRDHDHLRGLRTIPKVLYTYGYSWENDIWSVDVVEEAFYTLCGVDRTTSSVRPVIAEALAHFRNRMRWSVYADVLVALHAESAIPRGSFKCVSPSSGGWPSIDRAFLYQCVRKVRARTSNVRVNFAGPLKVDTFVDVYGQLLGYFCYRMLAHLLKIHCGQSANRNLLDAVAIKLSRDLMLPEVLRHYEAQFARLSE